MTTGCGRLVSLCAKTVVSNRIPESERVSSGKVCMCMVHVRRQRRPVSWCGLYVQRLVSNGNRIDAHAIQIRESQLARSHVGNSKRENEGQRKSHPNNKHHFVGSALTLHTLYPSASSPPKRRKSLHQRSVFQVSNECTASSITTLTVIEE
jgi:hypothetical protein